MKHTPLPYKVDYSDTNGHLGWSINSGQHNIATVYANIVKSPRPRNGLASLPENERSIATAAYIVQACNAFPDLLEACKAFVKACDTAPPVDLIQHIGKCCELARAAIKKAESHD